MRADQPSRAVIFANGSLAAYEEIRSLLNQSDYLIAADGGLRHLTALGLTPALLIGDLDSASAEEVGLARQNGARVDQRPIHKDETDLELAVEAALRQGVQEIRIVGALGGRLDMTLGNIYLLSLPELAAVDARLDDGVDEVFLIRAGNVPRNVAGKEGDVVSLLPLNGQAAGIRTVGLYYPLRGETLFRERTRGISNRMTGKVASVSLESGTLICIHTRKSRGEDFGGDEK